MGLAFLLMIDMNDLKKGHGLKCSNCVATGWALQTNVLSSASRNLQETTLFYKLTKTANRVAISVYFEKRVYILFRSISMIGQLFGYEFEKNKNKPHLLATLYFRNFAHSFLKGTFYAKSVKGIFLKSIIFYTNSRSVKSVVIFPCPSEVSL